MDSLRKITPRSSSAKGMLSVQFIVTELQQMQKVDNRCFSRRLRQGVRNAPWKNILGLGHLIFSLIDSLQKKYPQVIQYERHVVQPFQLQNFQGCRRWITGVFKGGLICPLEKIFLGLGHLIFSLIDSLQKSTPKSFSYKGIIQCGCQPQRSQGKVRQDQCFSPMS